MSLIAQQDHLDGRPTAYKRQNKPIPFFRELDHHYSSVHALDDCVNLTQEAQPLNPDSPPLQSKQKSIPLKRRIMTLFFSCIA